MFSRRADRDAGNGSGNGSLEGSQGLRGSRFERENMFERYTEKARRVIFFARYEASQFGSPYIETEHLLPHTGIGVIIDTGIAEIGAYDLC